MDILILKDEAVVYREMTDCKMFVTGPVAEVLRRSMLLYETIFFQNKFFTECVHTGERVMCVLRCSVLPVESQGEFSAIKHHNA